MDRKTKIIAFTGKGGVGKTSVSALSVRILHELYPDKKILAIDADPAVGLSVALGVEVSSTVDDIRKLFVKNAEEGNKEAAIELLSEAKFHLMDSLVEMDNISFLAIGRPESAGCYCKVNAYLKEVISLIASNFDYVVIDGEAGIEQVNRRVMEKVTHLILVSDGSKKGLQVIKTIHQVASELTMFEKCGLIINRVIDSSYLQGNIPQEIPLLAIIGDDKTMSINDMMGKSVFEIREDALILTKTKEALKKTGII